MDLGVLAAASTPKNPRRGAVHMAMGAVSAIMALDLIAAARMSTIDRSGRRRIGR